MFIIPESSCSIRSYFASAKNFIEVKRNGWKLSNTKKAYLWVIAELRQGCFWA